ncbi:MAG: radical SAM protein [Oscillospiraceae bacterium]|nr:radical SAM protein [Oscillospiraceae bacterium]
MSKFIHLLYVPTMNCNMSCRYCYLGDSTTELRSDKGYLETLRFAVDKFREADVIPFNISLHGGEVTTLSQGDFRDIVEYISNYYADNSALLSTNGFRVGRPHIKTNLLSLHKHIDAIRDFDVSISGSLDLPLSLHDKYRVTKDGKGTLERILKNIELLSSLSNRKKVSATIFDEHFRHLDEIVEDIKFLSEKTCLDMNDFNFMIGFEPQTECEVKLTPLSEEKQVLLYRRMYEEFMGSNLEKGLTTAWFAEFTPAYCTNCTNCGEKFFLLEKNGDIYSCVRGQSDRNFFYGNIFTDSATEILSSAAEKIFIAHNNSGFDEECAACEYLHLCKTGCPFVKNITGSPKSYTCKLQKEIYKTLPHDPIPKNFAYDYLCANHPRLADLRHIEEYAENSLPDLIAKDEKLKKVYDEDAFILFCDGVEYPLKSQLLKTKRDFITISKESDIRIYVRRDVLSALSDYPVNNALYMMLLSGDMVVYGDEQREKQAHVMTHLIFSPTLEKNISDKEGYFRADIGKLLSMYGDSLSAENANNLFFTTSALRDYHYAKQKNNAFYHIAAMNLPFQNIELFYFDPETFLSHIEE